MGWMDNNGQTKTKLELLAPKRLPLVSPLYRKSRLIFRPELSRSWWCIYFGIFWLELLNNFEAIWYIHYPVQWKFFKNSSAFDQSLYIEVHIYLQCSLEINPLNSIMSTDLICMGSLNYFEPAAVSFTPFPKGQFTKFIVYKSRGVLSFLVQTIIFTFWPNRL